VNQVLKFIACLGIPVCCLVAASCSNNPTERLDLSDATLEGTITYEGKRVPYAMVIVSNNLDPAATGHADADGNYKLECVPLGDVQIGVNTAVGRGIMTGRVLAAKQGGYVPKIEFVDVPEKFFDPSTSRITATISDGANTFDIVIE